MSSSWNVLASQPAYHNVLASLSLEHTRSSGVQSRDVKHSRDGDAAAAQSYPSQGEQ